MQGGRDIELWEFLLSLDRDGIVVDKHIVEVLAFLKHNHRPTAEVVLFRRM